MPRLTTSFNQVKTTNHDQWKALLMLITSASALCLFACNYATTVTGGDAYIGVWENVHAPELTMAISKTGDQFLIHKAGAPDRLATVRNGLLQFTDGSGGFLQYHRETDTITSSGNRDFLYRRKM